MMNAAMQVNSNSLHGILPNWVCLLAFELLLPPTRFRAG
jgi:hypothetical protein